MTVNNLKSTTSGNLYSDSTLTTWIDDSVKATISTTPSYNYSNIYTSDALTSMFSTSQDVSASTAFDAIIDVLKEEEIEEIIDKLLNRNHTLSGKFNSTIAYIVSNRHVSEKIP